jgi:hypothetical protein
MRTLQGLAASVLATMFCCCSKEPHPADKGRHLAPQYGDIARQFKDKATFRARCPVDGK